jgi:hypothetical protein
VLLDSASNFIVNRVRCVTFLDELFEADAKRLAISLPNIKHLGLKSASIESLEMLSSTGLSDLREISMATLSKFEVLVALQSFPRLHSLRGTVEGSQPDWDDFQFFDYCEKLKHVTRIRELKLPPHEVNLARVPMLCSLTKLDIPTPTVLDGIVDLPHLEWLALRHRYARSIVDYDEVDYRFSDDCIPPYFEPLSRCRALRRLFVFHFCPLKNRSLKSSINELNKRG